MILRRFKSFKPNERTIILLLSLLVGICSGTAAVLLSYLIERLTIAVNAPFSDVRFKWQYLILPGAGMLISLLVLRFLIKDNIGHGVTKVLVAVSRNESRIKAHNTWSSMLTSSITIGFGGSVGAEAPIVYTGAAIGSNIGRLCKLSYRDITLLLGCGAAGALAGIFKAPLAGVLFTIEILLFNISLSSMLPLLVSTVSATVVSYLFRGVDPIFDCELTPFAMSNLPFYLIMGIVLGLCALYFTHTTLKLEDRLAKIRNPFARWMLCASLLGVLVFFFPPLYGQGYGSLGILLQGKEFVLEGNTPMGALFDTSWGIPVFFALIFVFKVFTMTLTNSGGGVGGTFGPTLFAGAIMGFAIARTMNLLGAGVPEQNFVLVGMAALMASVMQAPMTAIFLIAEISGGYELLLPLILTSAVSFWTVRLFERYSIYTKRIAQSGDLLTHDNDQAIMTLLKTRDLVRDKYPRIDLDADFAEVCRITTGSTAAVFPVLDAKGRFQGLIDMDTFRKYLAKPAAYSSLHAYNLMTQAPETVTADEKMESVLAKFDRTNAWRLPVLDEDKRYIGFVSKSRILMAYRSELKAISSED